jgi:hypothetical protein
MNKNISVRVIDRLTTIELTKGRMNGCWRDLRLQKIAGYSSPCRIPRSLPLGGGLDAAKKRTRPRSELCRVTLFRWLISLQNPFGSLRENSSLASSAATIVSNKVSSSVCNVRPRRKRKRLAQSVTSLTTKERIRLLMETNRVITTRNGNNLPRVGNKLLKVAQSRVSWLRNQLYTYWNPSYQPGDGSAFDTSIGDSRVPSTVRQFKQGAVMDGRWWVWNVVWAVTPALLIAGYCETRGKAAMRDFHRSQELVELKKVLQYNAEDNSNGTLDEESFAAMATAILDAREAAEREPSAYETLLRWLSEMQTALNILWPNDALVRDADVNKPPNENGGADVAPTASTPSVSPGQAGRQAPQLPLPRDKSEPEPSVQNLLLRIQQLEATIQDNQAPLNTPPAAPVTTNTEISARQLEHSLQRVKQSGVRNRVEDELLQKWKPYLDSASMAAKAESPDSIKVNPSEPAGITIKMQEYLQCATRSLLLWMGQDLVVARKESGDDDAQGESSAQQASSTKGCAVNMCDHPASSNAEQLAPQASDVSSSQEAPDNGKTKQSTLRSLWPW